MREAVIERESRGKKRLSSNELKDFLVFAQGEYLDLFQKRGAFNKTKLISSLLK